MINLYTIGFTEKSAERFFYLLKDAGVTKLIDTRINTVSQLAGFAKKGDLEFFLKEIAGISYIHEPLFAPTKELLSSYRNKEVTWDEYEKIYIDIISGRNAETIFMPEELHNACLLCSEHLPEKCHRRLLTEYLQTKVNGIISKHLY